jgi:secreted trypsin-like serine protease
MNARWLPRELQVLVLAVLVACAACTAPVSSDASDANGETIGTTQQAIINGDDDNADPAVVALMLAGSVYCTGVLLTNNIVATAAHCVTPTPPDQVYFGNDPGTKKGTFIAVTTSRVHPDFDEDTLVNDIAVVGLASTAPVAPLNIFVKEFDDSYIGLEIRLIGFGATAGNGSGNLRKRTGTTAITSYTNDDFRFRPAPSQTCVGDSGGPAVAKIGDHEAVIGLTSSGDSNCATYGRDMRIDRYLPFIQGYAKAYSIPTGPASVDNSGCSASSRAPARSSSAAAVLLALACISVARSRRRGSRRSA